MMNEDDTHNIDGLIDGPYSVELNKKDRWIEKGSFVDYHKKGM